MVEIARVEETIFLPPECRAQVRELFSRHEGLVEVREEPHCEYSYVIAGDGGRLVVRQYTNGRLHMQGGAEDLGRALSRQISEILGEAEARGGGGGIEPASLLPFPHAGGDEAGKGDYFGPLVVVCAYMSAAQAREAAARGVTDSKGISDGRCLALAEYLRSELDGQWSRVVIGPDRYNRTYSQMKRRGENLNDLLARAHARCIRDLAGRTGSGSLTVLVDRFAREDLLLSHLDSPRHLEVRQVERGERDLAVAAASILARAEFLRALEALSKTVGVVLPKGAGDATVATAERIVRMHGWRSLFRVAKLHFANTGKIDLGGSAHGK